MEALSDTYYEILSIDNYARRMASVTYHSKAEEVVVFQQCLGIARVPVVRDALMASVVLEVAILACDSVEGLQDITIQDSLRVLLSFV